jgi:hypothetical protein
VVLLVGRSRRWATRVFSNQLVYGVLPGLGVFLIAAAVKIVVGDPLGNLLVAVATAVGLLGVVAISSSTVQQPQKPKLAQLSLRGR